MGRLENEIVESLTTLSAERGHGARPMFVFPLSLMASAQDSLRPFDEARYGDVARIAGRRRDERDAEG